MFKGENERCEEIMMIQAMGLKKRLEHTKAKCVVLGISGGLDSTLALLVCAKAFDLLGIERSRNSCHYHAWVWNDRSNLSKCL